mmetsp:Transcript_36114/g.69248  ORF Transcript_36114/g.69248 Transcript_36114/m.69248 type:complete len:216 (+) Transcript_36114:917-1564(+)
MMGLMMGLGITAVRSLRIVSMSKLLASSVSILRSNITSQHLSSSCVTWFFQGSTSLPAAVSAREMCTTSQQLNRHTCAMSLSSSATDSASLAHSHADLAGWLGGGRGTSGACWDCVCIACFSWKLTSFARSSPISSLMPTVFKSFWRAWDTNSDRMFFTCHRDCMRPTSVCHLKAAVAARLAHTSSCRLCTWSRSWFTSLRWNCSSCSMSPGCRK